MRIAVVFVLLGVFGAEGHPPKQTPTPLISVLVFDFAGVSGEVLNTGLRQATRILKSGGVEVVWVHCPVAPELLASVRPCMDAPGPLALVLHVLPRGVTTRQTDPGSAGFAVPAEDGGFGAFAGVFHHRVRELVTSINEAEVLGSVVAHELGHLLLGTGQHSAGGIMKGEWRYKQSILAAQGLLGFDPGQRRRMLENMRRRILASNLGEGRSRVPATAGGAAWRTSVGVGHPSYAAGLASLRATLGKSHSYSGSVMSQYSRHLERHGRKQEAKDLKRRADLILTGQSLTNHLGPAVAVQTLRSPVGSN
jgi:hypothetical protein